MQRGAARLRHRRRVLTLACLAGGAVAILWLVLRVGAPGIAVGLRAVGWRGVVAVSGYHLIATVLTGLAWWNLRRSGSPRVYVWGRWLRDAGSELLPLSQIGGYALGTRVPIIAGEAPSAILGSVVVDAALEFLAEVAFVALGAVLSLRLSNAATLAGPALIWIVPASLAAGAFIVLQARGHDLLSVAARRLDGTWFGPPLTRAVVAHAQLRRIYRRKSRLFQSAGLHFTAWFVAGTEAWLILRLMGARYDLATVFVLESLVFAARSLAFMVPGAAGVQEGAYVLLGTALGIPPQTALGLSLVKRARDLLLGSGALASWHLLESARLRRARASEMKGEPETEQSG